MKIRNQFLLFALSMLLAATFTYPVSAQSDSQYEENEWSIDIDPTSKARMNLLEDSFNFGAMPKDGIVTHDFKFINTGSDTLLITKVQPTCGCTTAPLKSDKIAPGETSEFSVKLNTKKLHGLLRKFINIECSDPINPYMRISFKATINDPEQIIVTLPVIADLGEIIKGSTGSIQIELTNTGSEIANLLIIDQPSDETLKIDFESKSLKPQESTQVNINFIGDIEPGDYFASITLEADGVSNSRFTIPIKGTVIE